MQRDEEQLGDVQITVRLPGDLYAALERLAREAERTVSGEVRLALRGHVEAARV